MLPCFYDQKPPTSFRKPEFLSPGPGKDLRWYGITLRSWSKLGHTEWPKSTEVWLSDVGSDTRSSALPKAHHYKTILAQPQNVLVPCVPSNLVPMVSTRHMHKHSSLQILLVFCRKSFTWCNKLLPFLFCGILQLEKIISLWLCVFLG